MIFVGAILPTPLYPLYRQTFGFSAVTLTLIYAVYVLGNLLALLLFGRLADQIGRRNASLPAIGFGVASTLVFAFAAGTGWLFAARALSGCATGLAATAAINRIAPAEQRSEVVSSYLIALFAGNSLPAIGIGLLSAAANPQVAHVTFAAVITLLAGIAAATGRKFTPSADRKQA